MDGAAGLVQVARLLWQRGLVAGIDGNVSIRRANGNVLITRTNTHKGLLTEAEIVEVTAQGERVAGEGRASTELGMHLAIYEARADVHAVVHAHPTHATACTLVGKSLEQPVLPELVLALGAVPTVPYSTTGTPALARAVGNAMRSHDAALLDRHGAVTVGPDLITALSRMEMLEHGAEVLLLADARGEVARIQGHEVRRLDALRRGDRSQ